VDDVSDRIDRNEAIELVGKAKFGDAWVGPTTPEEFELAKKYRARLTTGAIVPDHEAVAVYEAEEREARADRQQREVIHWLENRGLDCVRGLGEGLDRSRFVKVFNAEFGTPPKQASAQTPPVSAAAILKNKRYATDDELVAEGVRRILAQEQGWANPYQAARLLAERAEGVGTEDSKVDRLRTKIAKVIGN
jgi:hypothetical protein